MRVFALDECTYIIKEREGWNTGNIGYVLQAQSTQAGMRFFVVGDVMRNSPKPLDDLLDFRVDTYAKSIPVDQYVAASRHLNSFPVGNVGYPAALTRAFDMIAEFQPEGGWLEPDEEILRAMEQQQAQLDAPGPILEFRAQINHDSDGKQR